MQVEIALQWNDGYAENIYSFANNINTHDGGTHLVGLQERAHPHPQHLRRASSGLAKDMKERHPGRGHARGPDRGHLASRCPNPQFEGQTKGKLGNSEVKGIVESLVNEQLAAFLEENPTVAKRIVLQGAATPPARARPPARRAT